jgi:hypothetical protein
MRVRAEDLLSGRRAPLEQLLAFMELPWKDAWLGHAGRIVDRRLHHPDDLVDPLEVHRHPTTVELAREVGYEIASLNAGALEAQLRAEPDTAVDRIGRFV